MCGLFLGVERTVGHTFPARSLCRTWGWLQARAMCGQMQLSGNRIATAITISTMRQTLHASIFPTFWSAVSSIGQCRQGRGLFFIFVSFYRFPSVVGYLRTDDGAWRLLVVLLLQI